MTGLVAELETPQLPSLGVVIGGEMPGPVTVQEFCTPTAVHERLVVDPLDTRLGLAEMFPDRGLTQLLPLVTVSADPQDTDGAFDALTVTA